MAYNREVLEEWANGENWGDYMDRKGSLGPNVTTEQFKTIEKIYFSKIKRKIGFCEKILINHPEDPFLHFVLASLHYRDNLDKDSENLYMTKAKFHCQKALELNSDYKPAKKLLTDINSWLELLGAKQNDKMPNLEVRFNS